MASWSNAREAQGDGTLRRFTSTRSPDKRSQVLGLIIAASIGGGYVLAPTGLVAATASAAVFGPLCFAAHRHGATALTAVAAFAGLSGILVGLLPPGTWPLPPLLALLVVLATIGPERSSYLDRGRVDRLAAGLTVATGLVAPIALILWFNAAGDPSDSVEAAADILRELPAAALPLIGLSFAVVNAAVEEIIYRGLLQSAFSRTMGPLTGLVVQAALFGLAHLHGFPHGPVGVVLATTYGLALGVLRQRTRGLLAPWLAHLIADLVIFTLVVIHIM